MENPRAVEEAHRHYVTKMNSFIEKTKLPMPEADLENYHNKTEDEAVALFDNRKIGKNPEAFVKELKVSVRTMMPEN